MTGDPCQAAIEAVFNAPIFALALFNLLVLAWAVTATYQWIKASRERNLAEAKRDVWEAKYRSTHLVYLGKCDELNALKAAQKNGIVSGKE